eukprot:SM000024S07743  [mRNA]  locus=s24:104715:107718:- [translate_table: standard]
MLKECNMDPNETVQRLLNQDPFQDVKRRRDKKKEGTLGMRDAEMAQPRPRSAAAAPMRAGGRGSGGADWSSPGRGSVVPKLGAIEYGGGRGKVPPMQPRENGIHPSSRGGTLPPASASLVPPLVPALVMPGVALPPMSALHAGHLQSMDHVAAAPLGVPAVPDGGPPPVPAGTTYPQPQQRPPSQGWGSGGATMADMLKAAGTASAGVAPQLAAPQPLPPPLPQPPQALPMTSAPSDLQPSRPPYPSASLPPSPLDQPAATLGGGVYSSSSDPVLLPALDLRAGGAPPSSHIKRDIGTVGQLQRPIGDRPGPSQDAPTAVAAGMPSGGALGPSAAASALQPPQPPPAANPSPPAMLGSTPFDAGGGLSQAPSGMQLLPPSSEGPLGKADSSVTAVPRPGAMPQIPTRGPPVGSRPSFQPPQQQHGVGLPKAAGLDMEWQLKPMGQQPLQPQQQQYASAPPAAAASEALHATSLNNSMPAVSAKIQGLSLAGTTSEDCKPVKIPGHLQVPEADQSHLSFGSFSDVFGGSGSTLGSGYGSAAAGGSTSSGNGGGVEASAAAKADSASSQGSQVEPAPIVSSIGPAVQQSSAMGSAQYVPQQHHQQGGSAASLASLSSLSSGDSGSLQLPSAGAAPEVTAKMEVASSLQQQMPAGYAAYAAPALPSYPAGFSVIQQLPGHYASYDSAESQPSDLSRLPGIAMQQAYPDPVASYYSPAFRPSSEADARYSPFVTSTASANKYGLGTSSAASVHSLQASPDVG